MNRMLSYEEKDTWLHRLSGVTKLIFFLLWCITSAMTYDTRVLLAMCLLMIVMFVMSKTEWRQISAVMGVILFFMAVNLIAIFALSPYQGSVIYGTKTVLSPFLPGHEITAEQLFYEFNIFIKYITIVPAIFIFMVTTDPSEFAASMNLVGIPYTIAYSVAIALRYVPDIQDEYRKIRNAQEARGIEMSSKARLIDRIRRSAAIIFPLLFSSMERIDVVSNAMELRGFGKKKKRTWYSQKPLKRNDYLVIIFSAVFCAAALILTFYDGNRFYNPFV
ncbi:MAG: energy-coupling factor transporter transmembrane protein EcfT [Lachnospiraceae bacterium]|nr:energy-coupling factor transporter transmembrane protein EcfT [Lachnospiraceae bacterium]